MTQIHLRGESGAVVYFDRDALPEGVQKRIDRGDLIPCEPDGTVPPVPEDLVPDVPPPDAPPLPKRAAPRDAWVLFALSQGMDREQANSMTKAQLIAEFTRVQDD
ncbi:MAG: hypothetical protein JWO67_6722 [Streptosporangiaceae bacterium]|nr:hypothetical protein [Streptosporangiaceae bacterium]